MEGGHSSSAPPFDPELVVGTNFGPIVSRPNLTKGGVLANDRVERRLAAIVAGDVVGYSRLMGADEVGTLNALKAIRRELADPAIAAHHGRVVKTTGDGILIEFSSVVDAVACAVAIQGGMVARNAD